MPQTIQALAVVVIALLPGALYVWAVEREVGRWGVGLSDRVLRFVGGSAIFHAVVAPVSYGLWRQYGRALSAGEDVSWWLWSVPLLYVGVPAIAGTLVGRGQRLGKKWTRWAILSAAVAVDPDTGEFVIGPDGHIALEPGSLLIRWDEVEFLEFIDA